MASNNSISVIIPVRNRARELEECLSALKGRFDEIIVVDDGSTDATKDVASAFSTRVVALTGNRDANYCRNAGAQLAQGEILLFLDSDVILQPSAEEELQKAFSDAMVDAVVGIYAARHRHRNLASQFKNLWIRYSYLYSAGGIGWIFGAVSAVRKEVFTKNGGFDDRMMMKYGGEDMEFGGRMKTAQHHILLLPALEVEHLKRHTVASLLKNDFVRSQGIVDLAVRQQKVLQSVASGFVNIYPAFIFSCMLSWLMVAVLCLQRTTGMLFTLAGLTAMYTLINIPFLKYFYSHRGFLQTAAAVPLVISDHLVSGFGSAVGLVRNAAGRIVRR
jgi:glycosyltransferase involved in cell wall biosynthesis